MTHDIPNRNDTHPKYPWIRSRTKPDAPIRTREHLPDTGDAPSPKHIKCLHAQSEGVKKEEHSDYEKDEHHQGRRHDGRTKGFEGTAKTISRLLKEELHINLDRSDRGKIRRYRNEPRFRNREHPRNTQLWKPMQNLYGGYTKQSKTCSLYDSNCCAVYSIKGLQ